MKRLLSFVLTGLLAATGFGGFLMPADAYGAEADSQEMEKAILIVKSIVDIPDAFSNFGYSYSDPSENEGRNAGWQFNWSDNVNDKGQISASVDLSGTLTSYAKYENDMDGKQGIGKLTYDEGKKIAEGFLKKANPKNAADMRLTSKAGTGNTEGYSYVFSLFKNDSSVEFVEATVQVDKFKKEATSYQFTGSDEVGTYPDKTGVINPENAKKLYLSAGGIELKYFSNFDYKTEKLTIFPAYHMSDESKTIDAKSGKILYTYANDLVAYAKDAEARGSGSEENGRLTPEELSAVGKVNQLLSKEAAQAKARGLLQSMNYSFSPKSGNLTEDYIEKGKFYWEFSFENGFITLNAKTGELIRFNVYETEEQNGTAVSEEQARATGESFIKGAAQGDKWSQVREISRENKIDPRTDSVPANYDFVYGRQANGIYFDANALRVSVNRYTGRVNGYSCSWYDNAAFPAIDKIISGEKALEIADKVGNFQMLYVKGMDKNIKLGYKFTEAVPFYIDAFEGKKLRYDGKPYVEIQVPEYTDIAGHWVEPTVNALKENGYYMSGSEFAPSKRITQEVFLRFLYSPTQSGYDSDEFYSLMERRGIVKKEEKAPQKELLRQEAAMFTVRQLGLGKAAELAGIYKNPFQDKVESKYIGYASLSYALGIFGGSGNNNAISSDRPVKFSGKNALTNAEAAMVVYRTLEAE